MNQTAPHPDRLFVDRPVTSQPEDAGRVSSLRLLCQDTTDYTEAAARLFLMLCIPVSLLLCGMRVSASSEVRQTPQFQVPTWTAACLHPAMPTVRMDAVIR